MIRWLKVLLAKFLRSRIVIKPNEVNERQAVRWNFLSAVIYSHGMMKWDWKRYRGIDPRRER